MDRDRLIENDAAGTAPRSDRSFFPEHRSSDRVVYEPTSSRDVSGDTQAPSDQDIVVGRDRADTMPSRALQDPRELTPDEMHRISTDTTAAPQDAMAPSGPMDAPRVAAVAGEDVGEATNMAGRPLASSSVFSSGVGRWGSEIFAEIRPGMRVIDLAGEDLGKVDEVRMGDPQAVTTEGQESLEPTGGIIGDFARAFTGAEGEPDLPEPFRTRLIREGYVRVDGKGWFDTDRYLTADLIDRVTGDEVHLSVTRDNVPNNQGKDR